MIRFIKSIAAPKNKARQIPLGRVSIAVLMTGSVIFLGYTFSHMDLPLPFTGRYELQLEVPYAAGLDTKDRPPVRVAGVLSGQVSDVRRANGKAILMLSMEKSTKGKIFADAQAAISTESALQNVDVVIEPGTPSKPALHDGSKLVGGEDATPVTLDNITTNALGSDTRAYLQILLGELAIGLKDRPGELRSAVEKLDDVTDSGKRISGMVAERRRLMARMITELDVIFETTGRRGDELARAIQFGRRTLTATGRRDAELAASIRLLPGVLRESRRALTQVDALAEPLVPALDRMREPARELPEGMRSLRKLIGPARETLADASPLVRQGRGPARDLRRMLTDLGPTARASQPGIGRTDAVLDPLFDLSFDGTGPADQAPIRGIDALPRFIEGEQGAQSIGDANGVSGLGILVDAEPPRPENFGLPVDTPPDSQAMKEVRVDLVRALAEQCADEEHGNPMACLMQLPALRSFAPGGTP
jgi:phospholipid/cholesterol/gamma-HCH transport system substrate-binding protein